MEGGAAVKRVQGARGTGIVIGDPLSYAEKLYSYGFRVFHIVDLDGAEIGRPLEQHLRVASMIVEEFGVCVQYGGGLRSLEHVEKACNAGVVPVIGSAWLADPSILDDAFSLCGNVIAALDHSEGFIVYNAWRSKSRIRVVNAIKELEARRAGGYLLTSIKIEGSLQGPDIESLRVVRRLTARPLEYSGGISSLNDLAAVEAAGADAAILGMALAKGLLDPEEVATRYG